MVYTITKENIDTLKNEGLKADAKRYIEQYENFLEYIKESGAGISKEDYSKKEQNLCCIICLVFVSAEKTVTVAF